MTKYLWSVVVGMLLSPACSQALLASEPAGAFSQSANAAKIARVKAGDLKEARASWWGFDKSDATECLQNAINSGVSRLIVDNTGSDWIVNKPLHLASNQEIVFSDGVVVQAKENCFQGPVDSLFLAVKVHHCVLRGEGKVVLRMRKKDYQDPGRYAPAEWRSGIILRECSDITIRNLTVAQTGGDGIYLGTAQNQAGFNKKILIEDVVFDGNHRLGMAVISAEDLTIRRCKFLRAAGALPNGGLDFEPNEPGQRLVNCVVEDSVFASNRNPKGMNKDGGMGVSISPANLNAASQPVSISFKNCLFKDNDMGLTMWPIKSPQAKPVTGKVSFESCRFERDTVYLVNVVENGLSYLFKDCRFNLGTPETIAPARTPIMIVTDHRVKSPTIGGLTFENSTVTVKEGQLPLRLDFWAQAKLSEQIKGNLHVKQNNRSYEIKLPEYIQQNRIKLETSLHERQKTLKAQLPLPDEKQRQQDKNRIAGLKQKGLLKDNLVQNSGFSVGSDENVPRNWETWQSRESEGTFEFDQTEGLGMVQGSAVLSGIANGVILQEIAVKPGKTYVIQGWVRRAGQGFGSLRAAWKTPDKKWINNSEGPSFYESNLDQNTVQWKQIEGIVTAPKKATIMVIQGRAQYQRYAQDKIWFDDIAVYEIAQ